MGATLLTLFLIITRVAESGAALAVAVPWDGTCAWLFLVLLTLTAAVAGQAAAAAVCRAYRLNFSYALGVPPEGGSFVAFWTYAMGLCFLSTFGLYQYLLRRETQGHWAKYIPFIALGIPPTPSLCTLILCHRALVWEPCTVHFWEGVGGDGSGVFRGLWEYV